MKETSEVSEIQEAFAQQLVVWIAEETVQVPETHTGIWGTSPATTITLLDGENNEDVVVSCQALCGE